MAGDCHVVVDRKFEEQLRILERLDDSSSRDGVRTVSVNLHGFPENSARARSENSGNQIEQRSLTRPVRPENPDDFPGPDRERDIGHGRQPAEALRQLDYLKQHGASSQAFRSPPAAAPGWSESKPARKGWLWPRRRG